MNPRIGRRSQYNKIEKKPQSKAALFVEKNTKKNITMKQEFLYLEDVKTALNIHHLEVRFNIIKWMINKLSGTPENASLIKKLEESSDRDRHHLQKKFGISI
jgi:hypothetical protein